MPHPESLLARVLAQAHLHGPAAQSEELTEDTVKKPLLFLLHACEDSMPYSLTEHLNNPSLPFTIAPHTKISSLKFLYFVKEREACFLVGTLGIPSLQSALCDALAPRPWVYCTSVLPKPSLLLAKNTDS